MVNPGVKPSGMRAATHIILVFLVLLVLIAGMGAVYVFSLVHVQMPEGGRVISAWPRQFTERFAAYITVRDGAAGLSPEGMDALEAHGLWCRVLDAEGREIQAYGNTSIEGTVLEDTYASDGRVGRYQIGFPVRVTAVTMYLNADRFTSGRAVILPLLAGGVLLVSVAGLVYGLWITRQMRRVTGAVEEIAARVFQPMEGGGILEDVTRSLNRLDLEIRASDEMKADMDRQREEWIAGVTHDLKTPLSPIKGYAELLAEPQTPPPREVRRYAAVIQSSAARLERLMDEMKLIDQMDSGLIPLHLERQSVDRIVKETIIDLLNAPEHGEADLSYDGGACDAYALLDVALFRRAVENILRNAIVHNPPGTKVRVSLATGAQITLSIADNGRGIDLQEAGHLFDRYYRGAAAEGKTTGTGLGLAIAKQIMELHSGTITVQSEPGRGTTFDLTLPGAAN